MERLRSRPKREYYKGVLYVLPAFLLHFFVVGGPALSSFYVSLNEWNGIGAMRFIGLENFRRLLFEGEGFYNAIIHNFIWMGILATVPVAISVVVGVMVTQVGHFQKLFRLGFFLPFVVTPAVAAVIWKTYLDPYYGIALLFDRMGVEALADISLLGNPGTTLFAIEGIVIWRYWGFLLALVVAALHQVDPNLIEAGRIEGTNKWQELYHIIVPLIRPTVAFLVMLSIVNSFLAFAYVWVISRGGPAGASELISTYIYKRAFDHFEVGYVNAVNVVVTILFLGLYFVFRRLQKAGMEI